MKIKHIRPVLAVGAALAVTGGFAVEAATAPAADSWPGAAPNPSQPLELTLASGRRGRKR